MRAAGLRPDALQTVWCAWPGFARTRCRLSAR